MSRTKLERHVQRSAEVIVCMLGVVTVQSARTHTGLNKQRGSGSGGSREVCLSVDRVF